MEELKTTDALDREILEDARKKAYKILKTADDTIAAQNKNWEKKIIDAVEGIRNVYAGRIKKAEGEILARLPLDRRRLRSECAEAFLQKASDDFLRDLTREELLSILEKALLELFLCSARNGDNFGGSQPELLFSGMSLPEIQGLMEKVLSAAGREIPNLNYKESGPELNHEFPAVVINTRDIKISASVKAAASAMIKDSRAELAEALLGKGVLDD